MDALHAPEAPCGTVTVQQVRIPSVGLGTWQVTGDACRRMVAAALAMGYRHIDTAQVYGNEAEIGAELARSGIDRTQVWLTTKVWIDDLEPTRLPAAVDRSLARLRTDYVDLVLIHWPVLRDLPATLAAMRGLVGAGKVRHIGVSNFTATMLREALSYGPLLTNQVEYHPYLGQARMLEAAQRADLALTAYSPLAHGKVLRDPAIREIAITHDCTPAQVALAWLLAQPNVVVLPKAASEDHLAENLAARDVRLTDEARQRIATLQRGLRIIDPPWAPPWD